MAVTAVLPWPSLVGQCVCFTYAEGNEKRREPSEPLKTSTGFTTGSGRITRKTNGF